jgi:hypothetical protein
MDELLRPPRIRRFIFRIGGFSLFHLTRHSLILPQRLNRFYSMERAAIIFKMIGSLMLVYSVLGYALNLMDYELEIYGSTISVPDFSTFAILVGLSIFFWAIGHFFGRKAAKKKSTSGL